MGGKVIILLDKQIRDRVPRSVLASIIKMMLL